MKGLTHCCFTILWGLHICLPLFGQSISYEQLPDVPFVEVESVFVSPLNEVFLLTDQNIYKSDENGQSWNKIENLPDRFSVRSINFMEDGSAVFFNGYQAIIYENGEWINMLDDLGYIFTSNQPYTVYGNTFFFTKRDTLVKTNDKGLTFTRSEFLSDGEVIKMMTDSTMIYIFKKNNSNSGPDYFIDVLDHDFNFIERNNVLEGIIGMGNIRSVRNDESDIVFMHPYRDTLYFSNNGGQTMLTRKLENSSPYQWGVDNGKVYYIENGETFSIALDSGFETNVPVQENFGVDSRLLSVQSSHLISVKRLEFELKDIFENTTQEYSEFPFNDLPLEDIKINEQGHIFVSTSFDNSILRSKDEGLTWEHIPGSKFYNLNDDSTYTTLNPDDASQVISVDTDNQIVDVWDLSINISYAFSVNQGEYRIAFSTGNCLDISPKLEVSEDSGPFKKIYANILECLPHNPKVVYFQDKVYLFQDHYGSLYATIDLNDDFELEKVDLGSSTKYTSSITKDGQIYAHIENNFVQDPDNSFFTTLYSNDVRNSLMSAGGGPRGTLIYGNSIQGTFIVTLNGQHFYRENVLDNYVEIKVNDKPFDNFKNAVVDEKGRIIVLTEDGRIYRTTEINFETSTENIGGHTISLYPNPVDDILNIKLGGVHEGHISIIDLQGRQIYKTRIVSEDMHIQTSSFKPGFYFLEIHDSHNLKSLHKFFKVKL